LTKSNTNEILIRDDFRRDGLAASFLVDKELFESYIRSYPVGTKFNIGYPSICSEEFNQCKRILDIDCFTRKMELCLVGHAREQDLLTMSNLLKNKKNVSANIWIPSSAEASRNILGLDSAATLQIARKSIKYWKKISAQPLDIALTDVTNEEKDISYRIIEWYHELRSLGYRSIILCDTKGIGDVASLTKVFQAIDEFEWHPHNDNFKALKTSKIALEYGAKYIGTSYLGFSERMNMLDPRELIQNKMNLEELKKFHNQFELSFGNPITHRNEIYGKNIEVTGSHMKLWNSQKKKELIFGVTSNCDLVSRMIGRQISPDQLSKLKDEQLYKKKVLFLNKDQLHRMLTV